MECEVEEMVSSAVRLTRRCCVPVKNRCNKNTDLSEATAILRWDGIIVLYINNLWAQQLSLTT
jgi:hypothetical protein